MKKQRSAIRILASVFTLEPEGEIPKLKDKIVCEKLMDLDISITDVYKNLIIWILANPQVLTVYTLKFLKSLAGS